MNHIHHRLKRRQFLQGTAGMSLSLAGFTLLGGSNPLSAAAAESPPETKTIRLTTTPQTGICFAPQYLAEEFLKAEGFTDVQYVMTPSGGAAGAAVTSGKADLSMAAGSSEVILAVEAREPLVTLAGIHGGCYELFATDRVQTVGDLKGKSITAPAPNSAHHVYTAAMLGYVGIDPNKDVNWVFLPPPEGVKRLAEGKVDAIVTGPPQSQEMREKKIGHVVVNMMMDKPWSHYFCCMVVANREFMRKNPVATKRALRAMLKATDVCAREPERAARFMVDKYAMNYDHSLEALKCVNYQMWRDFDHSDTLRFFSLRMREIGFIKSSPAEIIARGTDWRYLNELKKELKNA